MFGPIDLGMSVDCSPLGSIKILPLRPKSHTQTPACMCDILRPNPVGLTGEGAVGGDCEL
jgi:hypothetical protein